MMLDFAQERIATPLRACDQAVEALNLVEFACGCLRNDVIHCQAGRCQQFIDALDRRWITDGPVSGEC